MKTELWTFDVETTGVDPETDRIVSAALVHLRADGTVDGNVLTWLIDPGVPIPAGATEVHGITDEHVRVMGDKAHGAILDIAQRLADVLESRVPLVVFNAPFDLTMLDREMRRHHGSGIVTDPTDPDPGDMGEPDAILERVIDPFLIDRWIDRYRKGKRTLTADAEFHGVEFAGEAHGAEADAITAGRLAQRLLEYPVLEAGLSGSGFEGLHNAQIRWAETLGESRRAYYLGKGLTDRAAEVSDAWPLRPLEPATVA